MKTRIPVLSTLIIAAAMLATACGGAAELPQTGAPVDMTVDMVEFMFNPATVTVPAGAEVNITLVNSGTLEHEWVVMNLGASATEPFDEEDEANIYWEEEVGPGDTSTQTFTAPTQPGEYQIVCGIAGHLEAGMTGALIVE